jgi:hypothetical protein
MPEYNPLISECYGAVFLALAVLSFRGSIKVIRHPRSRLKNYCAAAGFIASLWFGVVGLFFLLVG